MPASSGNNNAINAVPWVLEAIKGQVSSKHFVGGYRLEDRASFYPGFSVSINTGWETSGNVTTLLCAPLDTSKSALISYSDIVFRSALVEAIVADSADIVLAVDLSWRVRYARRTKADLQRAEKVTFRQGKPVKVGQEVEDSDAQSELVGLIKFSPRVLQRIFGDQSGASSVESGWNIPELLQFLLADGDLSVSCHNVAGDWSELNAPQDLARFVMGTKAETLDRLRSLAAKFYTEDQVRFTSQDFASNAQSALERVQAKFGDHEVIVRSSSRAEDSWTTANAGAFASVASVPANSAESLSAAIRTVIASYRTKDPEDQVFVQRMLRNVAASGVVFTRTLSRGAPYFSINYDSESGRTDSVTSGDAETQVLLVHHEAVALPQDAPPWLPDLLEGVREIVSLIGHDSLDLEFAIDAGGRVVLLQVRPIAVDHSEWAVNDTQLSNALLDASRRFEAEAASDQKLLGNRAIYGVMPDWNPAEIIGTRPSLLSLSLYRYLICDDVWATQRAEYGYRDVRPQRLLTSFAGRPYVNVRASMNSFIPSMLSEQLAGKLVTHYLDRLVEHPQFHDKVEFNIAFTCYSFDFDERAEQQLKPAGFSSAELVELRAGLVSVTKLGISRYQKDLEDVQELVEKQSSRAYQRSSPLDRALYLLEDCKRYGTKPFAHLARGAFVATTLLQSMVRKDFITQDTLDRYLESINTVAKDFVRESKASALDPVNWDLFLRKYGHLRPGTYDLNSATYRDRFQEIPDQFHAGSLTDDEVSAEPSCTFVWPEEATRRVEHALGKAGLDIGFDAFEHFCRSVIEGREYSKFVFTRDLSHALDALAAFGDAAGIDKDTLSHVPIGDFFGYAAGEKHTSAKQFFEGLSGFYRPHRDVALNSELPPLLTKPSDFYVFHFPKSHPNYIGSGAVTAQVALQTEKNTLTMDSVKGRVVVTPQADPGFDWLFGCGIAGLITQYGGANSHMAIRSAEFGLPAAIGVGDVIFEQLKHAGIVALDCQNQTLKVLS